MRRYLTDEEKEKEKNEALELQVPEHVPVVPYNIQLEREKEERRKLVETLRKKSGKIQPIIITKDGNVKKVDELTLIEQEYEIIRCVSNPIYFIETYLTIFDQTKGKGGEIVPFILFPYQKKLINDYLDNKFNAVNKYRQGGISTVTCGFIAWYVMFNQNRGVAIIADKLETARDELMNDVVNFIDGCPIWLRPKTGRDTNSNNFKDTQKLKRYDNGSSLGAFSSKGLRGMTPTLIFWDETAWTEKGDKFWTSAKPTLQTGGAAIMVSCVTKDTYLYTDKGIKQIKDFIPNEKLGAHLINEYSILGRNKLRKGNLFFNNGFVDTLKVKTTFTELESSLNHKYWAYKVSDKKYGIYKTSELEIGDYISIQYGMNIWGNNDDCSDFKPTISSYIKNKFNPTKITKDIAYLLGLYLSEGWASDIYHNPNNKNISKTTRFTLTCGDSLKHVFETHNFNHYSNDNIHYTTSSKNLGEFLKYLGFDLTKKAKEKIIPKRLFEMSKENIIALIQGIMDGDGYTCYSNETNTITVGIGLSSKIMIEQLRILLNNFGVLTQYQERITKPTKKVKVESNSYAIIASGKYAKKYFEEINFRFERKREIIKKYNFKLVKNFGINNDTIPNGGEILYNIYSKIKKKNIFNELLINNINIEPHVTEKKYKNKPYNRFNLLRLVKYVNENNLIDDNYENIISNNLIWSKIKSIEKSKNWTYDFSLPNDNPEENDFHHSVVYNQVVGYQTPNGLDPVFYKTFDGARRKENEFNAVELWWFNDPRYNKELCWLKNKGKLNEIKLIDENWDDKYRIKLMDDGWEASSPWFEEQIRGSNGDMKKIAQELMCINFDSLITIKNIYTNKIEKIKIFELYDRLYKNNIIENAVINESYRILNSSNEFVDFFTVSKTHKNIGYKITLENNMSIIVSEDHIFLANGCDMYAKSLIPNVAYISTIDGDFYVKSVEKIDDCDFYDIVDSENCEYSANGFSNHNCSFLGSGDNFIAEEYLKRIQENEIKTPIRQEYMDKNMWIWKDPQIGEDYIMSIDASPGHGEDNSTINFVKTIEVIEERVVTKNGTSKKVKIKKHKTEQVAEYYGKVTPQMLAEIAYQYGKAYNNAYAVIDITGGYGVQCVEKLLEMGYENVHYAEVTHKPSRDRLSGYIKIGRKAMTDGTVINVDLIPGFFIGNNRASVVLELQRAIHLEDVIIRSFRLLNELKTFVTVEGKRVADHKRTFHDDSIMGLSIGLYVLNFDLAKYKESKGITEKMLNAIITNNDIGEIGKKMDIKNRPMISPNSVSPLNPYGANAWLFNGIKNNKKI